MYNEIHETKIKTEFLTSHWIVAQSECTLVTTALVTVPRYSSHVLSVNCKISIQSVGELTCGIDLKNCL